MTTEADEIVERIESEEEDLESGTPVYRIRSYPSDPDLETLHSRWKRGEIIIPEFQRGFVWKPTQASRLIESFLMGLPVPGIFVFVQGTDQGAGSQKQLVIDGQQRLRSVFGYFDGKLPNGRAFSLTGVDDRWEDKKFTDLDPSEQSGLRYSVLRVINIEQWEPQNDSSSIYQIFERLNTGGTVLTPQEIRNSSYHGPFNDMLMETNNSPVWRDIFGTLQPDARMRDIEMLVRFLALYERSDSYAKPMKKFLSNYMGAHQRESTPNEYQRVFLDSAHRVVASLGKRPFHVRRGINVAVYDATMVAFAKSGSTPPDISERYKTLLADAHFIKATTAGTTDVDTVRERLELAREILFR
jgi:hypothetical protein